MLCCYISPLQIALFAGTILTVFIALVILCFLNWWLSNRKGSVSPYTGRPLRFASDLPYESKKAILSYLYDHQTYDNQLLDFSKAAFCRDTGRLFPKALNFFQVIELDWSFLQKRYPGNYVSWGSLTKEQQEEIKRVHISLEGFQTKYSSSLPSPRQIEPKLASLKPGPLYVDINTNTLLGWKCVPGTEFEVLVVQKPKSLKR